VPSSFENKANRYKARLPKGIGNAPVRIDVGKRWASFSLVGAKGSGVASANAVAYADVLPGVDVTYSAHNDELKEELILKSQASQSSFSWDLKTHPSITPTEETSGGIDFVGAEGETMLTLAPPLTYDSSGTESSFAPPHQLRAAGCTRRP